MIENLSLSTAVKTFSLRSLLNFPSDLSYYSAILSLCYNVIKADALIHYSLQVGHSSCPGSATSSEKVAEILKTLREDSQINFVTGTVFCTFSFAHLETFQSKIDNQFKMCALADADDA